MAVVDVEIIEKNKQILHMYLDPYLLVVVVVLIETDQIRHYMQHSFVEVYLSGMMGVVVNQEFIQQLFHKHKQVAYHPQDVYCNVRGGSPLLPALGRPEVEARRSPIDEVC